LQHLLERLSLTQEEERRRIARDLHDSVIQDLSGIIFSLSFLRSALPNNETKAQQEVDQLTKVAEATIQNIRQIIYDLRPTTLDSLGLIPTLEKYLERFATQQKVKAELKTNLKQRLPEKVETAIFRLTQEALNNIAKYAQAKNVCVNINQVKNELAVSIKDDGVGFDVNAVQKRASQSSGFGLSGMRERVRIINGNLQIQSAPGQGCQIAAVVPLTPLERKEQNGANISSYR
jgi:two-component system sensor histidine kinase DegS